jgi:hypothetical protein
VIIDWALALVNEWKRVVKVFRHSHDELIEDLGKYGKNILVGIGVIIAVLLLMFPLLMVLLGFVVMEGFQICCGHRGFGWAKQIVYLQLYLERP